MGIKSHDENDDVHGVPKFTQKKWGEATRKEAGQRKVFTQKFTKAEQKNGNGGRR